MTGNLIDTWKAISHVMASGPCWGPTLGGSGALMFSFGEPKIATLSHRSRMVVLQDGRNARGAPSVHVGGDVDVTLNPDLTMKWTAGQCQVDHLEDIKRIIRGECVSAIRLAVTHSEFHTSAGTLRKDSFSSVDNEDWIISYRPTGHLFSRVGDKVTVSQAQQGTFHDLGALPVEALCGG